MSRPVYFTSMVENLSYFFDSKTQNNEAVKSFQTFKVSINFLSFPLLELKAFYVQ